VLPGTSFAGNTFNGWFTSPVGGTLVTSPYTLSGNATLYAQWTASSFTVTFIANGGAPVASQVVSSGGSISSLPSDTQTGYTLNGWSDGTNTFAAGTSYGPVTSNVTLTAEWTINIDTLSFLPENGDANFTESGVFGLIFSAPTAPTYVGSTFLGWFTAPTGGWLVTWPYILVGSTTLYGQWTPNIELATFNSAGGTAVAAETALYGNSITLPAAPTYAGHVFGGWNDGTNTYAAGASYGPLTNNVTLTAIWTLANYTITFVADGGVAVSSVTQPSGSVVTLPTDTRTGYTFVGWYTAATGGTPVASPYTLTGNVSLYAVWMQKTKS
jgi:uncharacterized repeat protein (TIGR02543 family)